MGKSLKPPDSLPLQAVEGWLGLRNQGEPNETILPSMQAHPDAPRLRWEGPGPKFPVDSEQQESAAAAVWSLTTSKRNTGWNDMPAAPDT